MSTSIEGRQRRPRTGDLFADITTVRLVTATESGLLFDGDLTDTQVGDIWWRWTSSDDADQAERESIAADIAAAEAGTHGTSWLNDAYAKLARYAIGLQ